MQKKIIICDFEDSFTFNIYSKLKILHPNYLIEVIPKTKLLIFLQTFNTNEFDKVVFVLGPGPGHPDEYEYLFSPIQRLLKANNVYFFGVCLGHQILCSLNGMAIEHSYCPVHGQKEQYQLSQELASALGTSTSVEVQRYNSLAAKITPELLLRLSDKGLLLLDKDEVIILKCSNFTSYQFHPESVGTTCPNAFFGPISKFLL